MLLSYHFYFFNLDNAFLKFWLTDLCMMDRKFIFLNCGNCSYWLLEVGNYFFVKVKVKLACRRVALTFLARKTLEKEVSLPELPETRGGERFPNAMGRRG